MIPVSYIQEWSSKTPWPESRQIEQDLIISRTLCDLFNSSPLADKIAFRGGTAINKLLFGQSLRYSEDIDLVQIQPEPIGAIVDAVREALSWLGQCSRDQTGHSMRLIFKFNAEDNPDTALNLKIEINTREHKNCYEMKKYPYEVDNSWYKAKTNILSYEPEELFGTKLRALLQRRKNRDLFDLAEGLNRLSLDSEVIIACFEHYLLLEDNKITRAIAEQRMLEKLRLSLTDDVVPLLPVGVGFDTDRAIKAFNLVWAELITRIKGEPWKLTEKVINELRNAKMPNLLR